MLNTSSNQQNDCDLDYKINPIEIYNNYKKLSFTEDDEDDGDRLIPFIAQCYQQPRSNGKHETMVNYWFPFKTNLNEKDLIELLHSMYICAIEDYEITNGAIMGFYVYTSEISYFLKQRGLTFTAKINRIEGFKHIRGKLINIGRRRTHLGVSYDQFMAKADYFTSQLKKLRSDRKYDMWWYMMLNEFEREKKKSDEELIQVDDKRHSKIRELTFNFEINDSYNSRTTEYNPRIISYEILYLQQQIELNRMWSSMLRNQSYAQLYASEKKKLKIERASIPKNLLIMIILIRLSSNKQSTLSYSELSRITSKLKYDMIIPVHDRLFCLDNENHKIDCIYVGSDSFIYDHHEYNFMDFIDSKHWFKDFDDYKGHGYLDTNNCITPEKFIIPDILNKLKNILMININTEFNVSEENLLLILMNLELTLNELLWSVGDIESLITEIINRKQLQGDRKSVV